MISYVYDWLNNMPSPAIIRIAKILAKGTSENEHEAMQGIAGAYARMKHDHITFDDILALTADDLQTHFYQNTLNKLLDYILSEATDLSPSEKRTQYAQYSLIIAHKFAGIDEPTGQGSTNNSTNNRSSHTKTDEKTTRQDHTKSYHDRHGNNPNGDQSQNTHHNGTNNTQGDAHTKNTQTPHQEPKNHHPDPKSQTFTVFGHTFSFSPATFLAGMAESFGRGSFFHACFTQPLAGLNLLYVSFIFSIVIATILMLTLGLIYAIVPFTVPNISFSTAFAGLATASIAIKARQLFLSGWFG